MRTTISISEELLDETMKASGKKKYSEAIVSSLREYLAMKDRMAFLDMLLTQRLPHSWPKIKKARRSRKWSL